VYRVIEGEDHLFTVEAVSPGVVYPDAPKHQFESLPEDMQKRLVLLKAAGIGIPLIGVGEMVGHDEYHLDE
jgi:hypothetical protein